MPMIRRAVPLGACSRCLPPASPTPTAPASSGGKSASLRDDGAGGDRRAQMLVRQQGPGLQALPHGQRAEFLQRPPALPAGAGQALRGQAAAGGAGGRCGARPCRRSGRCCRSRSAPASRATSSAGRQVRRAVRQRADGAGSRQPRISTRLAPATAARLAWLAIVMDDRRMAVLLETANRAGPKPSAVRSAPEGRRASPSASERERPMSFSCSSLISSSARRRAPLLELIVPARSGPP